MKKKDEKDEQATSKEKNGWKGWASWNRAHFIDTTSLRPPLGKIKDNLLARP